MRNSPSYVHAPSLLGAGAALGLAFACTLADPVLRETDGGAATGGAASGGGSGGASTGGKGGSGTGGRSGLGTRGSGGVASGGAPTDVDGSAGDSGTDPDASATGGAPGTGGGAGTGGAPGTGGNGSGGGANVDECADALHDCHSSSTCRDTDGSFTCECPVGFSGGARSIACRPRVAVGNGHFCALMPDSTVRCWGSNDSGQLGDGTFVSHWETPAPVTGLTNVAVIDAGTYGTCAVLKDGAVRCWGANSEGQLGDNSQTDRAAPVTVTGLTDAVAVDMFNGHTCAARRDGSVRCWGDNAKGQIGAAGVGTAVLTPRTIPGVTGAHGVAVGVTESCAISRSNGAVQCWGEGYLGDSSVTSSTAPVAAVGLTGVLELQFGPFHACARTTRSDVWCWGNADMLGGGASGSDSVNPRAVSSVAAIGLSVTFYGTIVVEPAGTIVSWGGGETPVPSANMTNVAAVSDMLTNHCAVLRDGAVVCSTGGSFTPVAGLDLF